MGTAALLLLLLYYYTVPTHAIKRRKCSCPRAAFFPSTPIINNCRQKCQRSPKSRSLELELYSRCSCPCFFFLVTYYCSTVLFHLSTPAKSCFHEAHTPSPGNSSRIGPATRITRKQVTTRAKQKQPTQKDDTHVYNLYPCTIKKSNTLKIFEHTSTLKTAQHSFHHRPSNIIRAKRGLPRFQEGEAVLFLQCPLNSRAFLSPAIIWCPARAHFKNTISKKMCRFLYTFVRSSHPQSGLYRYYGKLLPKPCNYDDKPVQK